MTKPSLASTLSSLPELKNWRMTLGATFAVILAAIAGVEDITEGEVPDLEGIYLLLLTAIVAWQGFWGRDARMSSQASGVRKEPEA